MMRRLAGLMVTDRQHVSHRLECDYWIYRARRVTYADVEDQFTDRPAGTIQHLVNEWAPRVGLEPAPVGRPSVRCEYWTAQQHRDMIEEQATFDPRARTTKPPRRDIGPITIVERRGKRGMIDGRHRSESAATTRQGLCGRCWWLSWTNSGSGDAVMVLTVQGDDAMRPKPCLAK